MRTIGALPTPMFLDLDRRVRAIGERRYRYSPGAFRLARNIFSQSLNESLNASTALAEQDYRDNLIAVGRLGENLRRSMVLDLLELETSPFGIPLDAPTKAELETLSKIRDSIDSLPQILQIPKDDLFKTLVPTLDTLEKYASQIPRKGKPVDFLQHVTDGEDPVLTALIGWSSNRPQLRKLVKMVDKVHNYNKDRDQQLEKTNRYLEVMNAFLKDSGKTLLFDEKGYLWFEIEALPGHRHPTSFSSGEGQLFVILTHLFFNPLVHEDNVFIVDEPGTFSSCSVARAFCG
jgi:hypothetical protein